jgi:hypothetical protein
MLNLKQAAYIILLSSLVLAGLNLNREAAATSGIEIDPPEWFCLDHIYLPIIREAGPTVQTGMQPLAPAGDPGDPIVDFNGDGCPDLVIGAASEARLTVLYGGAGGLWGNRAQELLGADLLPDAFSTGGFGVHLQAADFDNDGYTDLAIGWSDGWSSDDAGAVVVLYGSSLGLTSDRLETWHQDSGGASSVAMLDTAEANDVYGVRLAAGDFNGDSYADLAVGVAGETVTADGQGAVSVIYGSSTGLTMVGNQFLHQGDFLTQVETLRGGDSVDNGDLLGAPEADESFGIRIEVGNINGDNYDDLIVGTFNEAIGSGSQEGAVSVIYGTAAGLSPLNNEHFHQDAYYLDTDGDGVQNSSDPDGTYGDDEDWDAFGWALASADFDGDGYDDIAIGIPGESITYSGTERAGAGGVAIVYGSAAGVTMTDNQFWHQRHGFTEAGQMIGTLFGSDPGPGDSFGYRLETGDFNGDDYADLAISSNGEELPGASNAGTVNILYGDDIGLWAHFNQSFNQDEIIFEGQATSDLLGTAGDDENFGRGLSSGDYNLDGYTDLVIGVPFDRAANGDKVGAFHILFGYQQIGLVGVGNQFWNADGGMDNLGNLFGDLPGAPAAFALFGFIIE